MSYNPKMLKFDYSFLTCKGGAEIQVGDGVEIQTPDEEATILCSEMGTRGYRIVRWYVREDGVNHIVMEKQWRG